jgi:hypothetical protein
MAGSKSIIHIRFGPNSLVCPLLSHPHDPAVALHSLLRAEFPSASPLIPSPFLFLLWRFYVGLALSVASSAAHWKS